MNDMLREMEAKLEAGVPLSQMDQDSGGAGPAAAPVSGDENRLESISPGAASVSPSSVRSSSAKSGRGTTRVGPRKVVSRHPAKVPFRPRADNRTHNPEQLMTIKRDNVNLLSNLERIQRKGGGTDNRPAKPVRHVAAASINRHQGFAKQSIENHALLNRLRRVKGTLSTGGVGQIRRNNPAPKKRKPPKARPEWNDVPVGPMPRN